MTEQQQIKQTEQTYGDWAYKAIAKHYNKFIKYEEKVLKDKEPENLHQMRVGMRRLRSAVSGFALAVDLPSVVTPSQIGKVAKILGELRDIDVLQETLVTGYQPYIVKSERESFELVLKKLQKRRKSAFKTVVKTLESKSYSKLKSNCESWLDNPAYQTIAAIDIKQVLPDLLLPQISHLLLHPGWLIGVEIIDGKIELAGESTIKLKGDLDLTEEKTLHDLRKVAKKIRYNMELFKDIYRQNYSNYLQEIEEVQEILGVMQDCYVLESFLSEVLERDLAETLPTFKKIIRENRQQQWQKWRMKQEYFLNISKRQDLRTTIQHPL
jgi:CHAD domain-containing protein